MPDQTRLLGCILKNALVKIASISLRLNAERIGNNRKHRSQALQLRAQ